MKWDRVLLDLTTVPSLLSSVGEAYTAAGIPMTKTACGALKKCGVRADSIRSRDLLLRLYGALVRTCSISGNKPSSCSTSWFGFGSSCNWHEAGGVVHCELIFTSCCAQLDEANGLVHPCLLWHRISERVLPAALGVWSLLDVGYRRDVQLTCGKEGPLWFAAMEREQVIDLGLDLLPHWIAVAGGDRSVDAVLPSGVDVGDELAVVEFILLENMSAPS